MANDSGSLQKFVMGSWHGMGPWGFTPYGFRLTQVFETHFLATLSFKFKVNAWRLSLT
jgi:hypothetical protein